MKEDLNLPEDNSEKDSKSLFEEERGMSEREEELERHQKEFEYREVEGRELREKEKKKLVLREKIWKYLVIGLSVLLLILLYFWLLR